MRLSQLAYSFTCGRYRPYGQVHDHGEREQGLVWGDNKGSTGA